MCLTHPYDLLEALRKKTEDDDDAHRVGFEDIKFYMYILYVSTFARYSHGARWGERK